MRGRKKDLVHQNRVGALVEFLRLAAAGRCQLAGPSVFTGVVSRVSRSRDIPPDQSPQSRLISHICDCLIVLLEAVFIMRDLLYASDVAHLGRYILSEYHWLGAQVPFQTMFPWAEVALRQPAYCTVLCAVSLRKWGYDRRPLFIRTQKCLMGCQYWCQCPYCTQ